MESSNFVLILVQNRDIRYEQGVVLEPILLQK